MDHYAVFEHIICVMQQISNICFAQACIWYLAQDTVTIYTIPSYEGRVDSNSILCEIPDTRLRKAYVRNLLCMTQFSVVLNTA